MTNGEAVKYLEYLKENYTRQGALMCQAVDTAIEALKLDRAAILRLCNEIEDEVTDIAFNSTHYHIRDCCEAIRKYLKQIGKELTGDAEH